MADTKEPVRKKGLHGWRAAVAVFGCGTLAAFGVFGAIVGVLNLLLTTAVSGISSNDEGVPVVVQSAQPREELEPGALDLCSDYLVNISDIDIRNTLSVEHSDDAQDPGYGSEDLRVVSGQCSFDVTPQYGSTSQWVFDFNFNAIIYDPAQNRDRVAKDMLAQRLDEVESELVSVKSRADHEWSDGSHSIYGESASGVSKYIVVSRTRSAVYTVIFAGDPGSVEQGIVPEFDFQRQADALIGRLHERFFRVIPE
ncbi:hypothetical protein [Nocardiopsis sp. FIRDI 009]|uniref:hypothetical protein n=1 Tax=Nocardiopsis sp. FIRDI 009 TaxID=714197 RepID=UPI0013003682|nr:hypothetical protein [Nocardiopsis sp. FIRDI 009]